MKTQTASVRQITLGALLAFSTLIAVPGHANSLSSLGSIIDDEDPTETVDILVLYSSDTEAYFDGEPTVPIRTWITQVNTLFEQSGIDIQMRLVGTEPHTVAASGFDILHDLRNDAGVQEARDEYGADIVTLIQSQGASASSICGVAYLTIQAASAYNVVGPRCGAESLAHEIGHNMGLAHSRRQGDDSGAEYRYGLGHGVVGVFSTLMAYDHEFDADSRRTPYFSNPRLTCQGLPCGVEEGKPAEADAVKAVNNVRSVIAAHRPTKVPDDGGGGGDGDNSIGGIWDGDTPPAVEFNSVTFNQTSSGMWKAVAFEGNFDAPPVVVAGPPSYNGVQPTAVRIRNVTANGFEIQLDEWDYLDGPHATETVSYMAAPAGSADLGGLQVAAGRIGDLNHRWRAVPYGTSFAQPPVVLTQQASDNGGQATTTRLRNVTASGFDVRLQEEEANDGAHAPEMVHFIAIQPGWSVLDDYRVGVGRTGNSLTHGWRSIQFPGTFENPHFLAGMQTADGPDTATMRYRELSEYGVKVKVEEEKSRDPETGHTTEDAGWVIATGTRNQAVLDDGTYLIKPAHAEKCIEVPAESVASESRIEQWSCHGAVNQRWRFARQPSGYYEIRAQHSGMCMSIPDGIASRIPLLHRACEGGEHQQWRVVDAGAGSYHLVSRQSGMAVSIYESARYNQATVMQRTLSDTPDQSLNLDRVAD